MSKSLIFLTERAFIYHPCYNNETSCNRRSADGARIWTPTASDTMPHEN